MGPVPQSRNIVRSGCREPAQWPIRALTTPRKQSVLRESRPPSSSRSASLPLADGTPAVHLPTLWGDLASRPAMQWGNPPGRQTIQRIALHLRGRHWLLVSYHNYNVGQKAPVLARVVYVPARMVPVPARLVRVPASLASVRVSSEQFAQTFKELHEGQRKNRARRKGSRLVYSPQWARRNAELTGTSHHRGTETQSGNRISALVAPICLPFSVPLCLCAEKGRLEARVPQDAPIATTPLAKLFGPYANGLQTLCSNRSIMRQNVSKNDCLPYWRVSHNILYIRHLPKSDRGVWGYRRVSGTVNMRPGLMLTVLVSADGLCAGGGGLSKQRSSGAHGRQEARFGHAPPDPHGALGRTIHRGDAESAE